jgi:hypothetical protein
VTSLTTFKLKFESAGMSAETSALAFGAGAATVQAALTGLSLIGGGNASVSKATVDGADVYTVTFQGGPVAKDVAQLIASIVQDGADVVNMQSIRQDMFFLGGGSDDTVNLDVNAISGAVITSIGVNAKITFDGQAGSDTRRLRRSSWFKPRGAPAWRRSPIQTIVVNATQGTFTVSFNDQESAPLAYNISAADLQAVLKSHHATRGPFRRD